MKYLSLYLHIPFCIKKCNYCDFLSAPPCGKEQAEYVEALCQEIRENSVFYQDRIIDTIFIGGGTPSLLFVSEIEKIMETVNQCFHLADETEITIEVNPGTVNKEKLECYKRLGINRLSIGLQSANNKELRTLGRIHTWEQFLITWKLVRECGFENVNIDIMSALPEQTLEDYQQTLQQILALQPEHISAYSLIIEEGTSFFDRFGPDAVEEDKLPNEETDRAMYELTELMLEQQGYYRYEISNYAKAGLECKHNIGYWQRKDYLGLGLGAASLIDNVRFQRETDLETYIRTFMPKQNKKAGQGFILWKEREQIQTNEDNIQSGAIPRIEADKTVAEKVIVEKQKLSLQEQMEEFMFLGLRLMEGISPAKFQQEFGVSLWEIYGKQIAELEQKKLLEYRKETERYALTKQGIDVSNQVFVEFLF